ncbi:MAG: response regulator transcription factor [Bacteroidetes bacterium]|nr:response regulator transcription factor [Bacteroidota bacterium]MCW5893983.1 response regulator transcription factor [Bacteroidota bacterium]
MDVLIADDHQLIREGIKYMLSEAPEVGVIGEARNAEEILAQIAGHPWDVLVLDINLPGRSGLDVLKEIRVKHPKLPVLILSMYPEDQFAVRVIKAGAAGYLTKSSAAKELVDALRKIASGGKYINEAVAEKLAEAVDAGISATPHERLSDREFEIFKLIGSGKTVGEIAELLKRSVKTISTHRTHILEKMNLHNNADIMQYVIEHKLTE